MNYTDIYSFITSQEANFSLPITISENYEWNMRDHINLTVLYKNSHYKTGKDDNKPFKNIIRPILNLAYRAEGFDVKDINLFVNDAKNYYKSFLIKKYHEKWARENHIDTFIDNLVESYVDYGGVLVKDVNNVRPEVVPMQRIAFVDQTDILCGPIAERHNYSPDELRNEAGKNWKNIEDVITLAQDNKIVDKKSGQHANTPGKYIEVYEVHGVFPKHWLYDTDKIGNYEGNYYDPESDENEMVRQLHICTFYQSEDGNKHGITLYKGKEKEIPYKLLLRDEIFGRALGLGGAEELFEPQVWVNYSEIHKKNMLDAASKMLLQTTDPAYANRNKIQNMDNLEITITEPKTRIEPINTQPINFQFFEKSILDWEDHARQMGAATEAVLGEPPTAGTPFKLQDLLVQQGLSLHEYRKGKIATFVGEIYKDWIIPHLSAEIIEGQEFLSELDLSELQNVADNLVIHETNKMLKEKILNGEEILSEDEEAHKQMVREQFMKGGNKKFIEILKGEMKDAPIDVEVNIVGKQKNLSQIVDKLTNIFRQLISAPQVLDDPRMAKIFNQILESSGLSPMDFYQKPQPQMQQPQMQQPQMPQLPQGQPALTMK